MKTWCEFRPLPVVLRTIKTHISGSRCGVPVWVAMLAFALCSGVAGAQTADERKVMDLANASRAQAGLKPLQWDAGLAAAAHAHAVLMAHEGPISHRYGGEADLPERAAKAGARFSLIEENIAVGPTPEQIHDGWMHSQGHHDNLMNGQIDRIGVALVAAKGVLYAAADYARGVEQQTAAQVEATVGKVVQARGLALVTENAGARAYCAQEGNSSAGTSGALRPRFLMRWQSADIAKLPQQLEDALKGGKFKQASVGACEPKSDGAAGAAFSGYRVAVLLY